MRPLLLVITADDLFNHPTEVLERVRAALWARGYRPPQRRISPEWAREFVDRS